MGKHNRAVDRVFADHDTNDYPVLNDGQPVNLSGTPGNSQLPRTTPPRPGEHLSPSAGHRTQIETGSPEASQRLTDSMQRGLSRAARHRQAVQRIVEGSEDPAGYLTHVMGLNRDDRA